MHPRYTLSAIALAITSYAHADTTPTYSLDDVIVTATRTPTSDVTATYDSEVYTQAMIKASGATTLVDYLTQNTALTVMPSYGNQFTPLLDMRGYGLSNGFQNMVISLDGQRLNNIDGMPALLGSIPLSSIDRIEITPGSGSVIYGDGATAGTIQIYTHPHKGVTLATSAGNHGQLTGTVTAGLSTELLQLSASSDYQHSDGTSQADITGHKDASTLNTQTGQIKFRPLETLWLSLNGASSRADTRYVGPLTLAQFQSDPTQNGGNQYNHQALNSDQWRFGAAWDITSLTKLTLSHNQENKLSDYISPYPYTSNYDYTTDDIALIHNGDSWKLTTGVQSFNGTRASVSSFTTPNNTSKNNLGYYAHGEYHLGQLTLSAGARHEKVDYNYAPAGGTALFSNQQFNAWDIGTNYQFNPKTSVFANYNHAFLAPDIDSFFNTFTGSFNGFIVPETVKTLTVGVNHATDQHKVKIALFRADLNNEIYYNPFTYTSTNLDQSHKYGIELRDVWHINEQLSLNARYTYTRAIIDRASDGVGGTYNGNDLPGVPKHGINLGMTYLWTDHSTINLTQMWRSTAYAANDFANNATQRQAAIQSTNFAVHYHYKNYEASAAIDNIFAHSNGLWVQDDTIYPVNFTRNYRIGLKASF
ncbi:TonB-dependent receptor plug domain-containing protein [Sulfuriferula nivalis]|uniref:TonB-dependent receptor n=1 Tax=Sulfuriferula nivalis TaxID=2675298 RepID=A0A809SAZ1_9PROT|nr:TonB-dependent receptor [Sulfuriferula nivalis]BBP02343.1 TonB-dependent receptor [Sulfuriferula nivalis]